VAHDVIGKTIRYLDKNRRYLVEDPSFFVMKSLARFEFARNRASRPSPVTASDAVQSSRVSVQHSMSEVLSTLKREGYYVGLTLTPETVSSLQEAARTSQCFADRRAEEPFNIAEREVVEQRLGRKIKVASYFDQQESWPVFAALRNDPVLLAIARAYLGCAPVYMRSEILWSFPAQSTREELREAAQTFHCDINDFRTIKFFFHLSDVGPGSGPHMYIKKGPRHRTLFHQALGQRITSLPESSLLATYRANEIVSVQGKAGTGFAGDPYYFHKGETPKSDTRLLAQLEFGCRSYRMWYVY
jgi:hypothetical protein